MAGNAETKTMEDEMKISIRLVYVSIVYVADGHFNGVSNNRVFTTTQTSLQFH